MRGRRKGDGAKGAGVEGAGVGWAVQSAEAQIELGRLRRYRDFLEREHCPLFLE
jgi:hypothetical protein